MHNRSTLFILIFLILAFDTATASAGAAVMATKQRAGKGKQQAQRQQQQIQVQRQVQIERQRQIMIQQQQEVVEIEADIPMEEVKDIVSLQDIYNSLATSSRAWTLIMDEQAKEIVVQHFIDKFRETNAVIRKPASTYVSLIDGMASSQPETPFENVLRIAAVMEYDFDIGQDKDALARKALGEKLYLENKKRLAK